MFNIENSRFVKVWNVAVNENYVTADLSTSRKEKDGNYTNSNYKFCKFIGSCLADAKNMQKGDTITILKGAIGKRKDKDGKLWDNVLVFDFEITQRAEQKQDEFEGFESIEDDDNSSDIPF